MNKKYNILIIDDDPYTLESFEFIENLGDDCQIFTAIGFSKAGEFIENNIIDIVILDVIMPEINGYDIIKILKEKLNTQNAYYIFMSGDKNKLHDRLKGYCLGVHDFIPKPFDIKEVEMIIRNKLSFLKQRNTKEKTEGNIDKSISNFVLDNNSKKLFLDKKEINLTNLEYRLIEYFIINHSKILIADNLIEYVWGNKDNAYSDNLRTLIYKLRNKIEENITDKKYIHNSKSNGYIFYPMGR